MEFKQLEAFVNVVKYKSFSKAADATFLTQPTISAHVRSLEDELGVSLINRYGKESTPTSEGAEFYRYAQSLLNIREEAAQSLLRKEKPKIGGVVRLCTSSIPGQYMLPELITEFRKKYPEVRFYVDQSDSRQTWDAVQEGSGELGFVGEYVRVSGMVSHYLRGDSTVLITPQNQKFLALRKISDSVSYEDFVNEPFLQREKGSGARSTFEELCAKRGVALNIVATLNSLGALRQSVAKGMGVSLISALAAAEDTSCSGHLTFRIRNLDPELCRKFYLIYSKGVTLSPAAAAFRDFTLKWYADTKENF